MYHLFFLSLLSFLLFWNEGHSATASLTLSSSTKKEKPPLPPKSPIVERKAALLTKDAKKKKLLSNPISFTGAQWAHNQGIEGQGQTAVVMEYDIPKAVIGLGQITVIQHGLSHTKPGEKNHADAVIDSLLLVAPEARVVLIDGSFDLPDYLSLTKGQLSQIEKSHVISRSLGFNEDHLLTMRPAIT